MYSLLPEPGGPHQEVVGTGRGDHQRPLGRFLPAHIGVVIVVVRKGLNSSCNREGVGSISRCPAKKAAASASDATGITSKFSTTAASAALESGTTNHGALFVCGGNGHRQRPFGRSRAAFERQFTDDRVMFEAIGRQLAAAGQPQRDWEIKRGGLFREFSRGQVDDHTVEWALIARVDHRPLDPMRAFLDRRFG